MTIAVTFGFNYATPGKLTGFTETHFLLNMTDAGNPLAIQAAKDLAQLRVNLLGRGAYLFEVRLSDTDVDRDSVQLSVGDVQNPDTIPSTPVEATLNAYGQADQSNACVRVRLAQSSKKWKNFFMAGVPDAIINTALRTVDINAVPLWGTMYKRWADKIAVVGGGIWGFKGIHRTDEGGIYEAKPITAYVTEGLAPNRMGIVLSLAGINWQVGQTVHIGKATLFNRGYQSPVGKWVIGASTVDVGNNTVTYFLKGTETINLNNIRDNGRANIVLPFYFPYQTQQIMGYGTRKRGVGSSKQVGKSRRTVQKV